MVGDDEFDLVAGQATWVPAGVPHCFRNRGNGPMTIYWVYGGRDVTRTITATGETFEHLSESDRARPCAGATAPPRMSAVVTVNPATGKRLAEYPAFTDAAVDAALDHAAAAQAAGLASTFADRGRRAAPGRGAPAGRGRTISPCWSPARWASRWPRRAPRWRSAPRPATSTPSTRGSSSRTSRSRRPADRSWIGYEPVGVVLAVMPWNFPLWQVVRFAAPALMAGNAALLKHSPNTTGCALAIQDVLDRGRRARRPVHRAGRRRAGGPGRHASGSSRTRGSGRSPSPAASGPAWRSARRRVEAIKKSVLELGGSDPFVVLADADLPRVAALAARGRFLNAGQSCISPKRLIVDATVAEEFTRLLVAEVEALAVGDPEAPGTDVGPMARADLLDGVHRQVEASVAAGARLLTGGRRLDGPGHFYAPTVLADVAPGQPAYDEEIFGPVAAVIVADGEDEAVRIANDTRFGLGASVWTSDPARGVAVGRRIRSGAVFVNAVVASDVRMPFGGTRASGYGRELAAAGIREFVNVRTWWVLDEPASTAPASE